MSIPPPPRAGKGKGAPPPAEDTLGALSVTVAALPVPALAPPSKHRSVTRTAPLNFTVEPGLRRRFARVAFELECHQVEILETLADLYLDDSHLLAEVAARRDRRRNTTA